MAGNRYLLYGSVRYALGILRPLQAAARARGDEADVFSSTAAALVRRGTPAVVAMQYEITDEAAIEFLQALRHRVAQAFDLVPGTFFRLAVSDTSPGVSMRSPIHSASSMVMRGHSDAFVMTRASGPWCPY